MDPAIVDDYFIYNALKWFLLIVVGIITFLFIFFKIKGKLNAKRNSAPAEQVSKSKKKLPDILKDHEINQIQTEYIYVEPETEPEYRGRNYPK